MSKLQSALGRQSRHARAHGKSAHKATRVKRMKDRNVRKWIKRHEL